MTRRHDRALGRPVQRHDRIAWRADASRRREGPGGSWDVPGVACRSGIQIYEDERGTVRELRPHHEVMDPASLATLVAVTLTLQHPGQGPDQDGGLGEVTPENFRALVHGTVLSVTPDAPEQGLVEVWTRLQSAEIQDAAKAGTRELSCGYEAVLLDPHDPANADYVAQLGPEPGVTHDGERYDLVQTRIRYNHLAVVDQARAGPVARLRLDRKAQMHTDYVEQRGSEWVILSKAGEVLEQGFESEEAANERLRQIEAAKAAQGDGTHEAGERYDSHTARGAAAMKITIKRRDGQTNTHEIQDKSRWIVDALGAHKPAEELRADADGVLTVAIEGKPEMVLPEEMVNQALAAMGIGSAGPSQPEPEEPGMMGDEGMGSPEEEQMMPKMDAKAIAKIVDARVKQALDAALPKATRTITDSVMTSARERAALDRAALPVLGQRFDYAAHDAHGIAVEVLRADGSPRLTQAEKLAAAARKGDARAAGRLEQLMEDALDRRRDALDSTGDLGAAMFQLGSEMSRTDADDDQPSWKKKADARRALASGRKPAESAAN